MITQKLKIKNSTYEHDSRYACAFRMLFINFELSQDEGFIKNLRNKFEMDSWMIQTLLSEVKTKLSQVETFKLEKENQILILEKELENGVSNKMFLGTKGRREKYKITSKINYLKNNLNKPIIFGTKSLLRKISFLSNPVQGESQKHKRIRKRKLRRFKKEYSNKRNIPISIIGEAPQKSNRKFDFDFKNNKVVYKPKKGVKHPIEFYCSKKQKQELLKLQEQVGEQAISVRVDNGYIYFSYDEQKLNNFHFNENEYFQELRKIPKENKEKRKDCYKRWVHEQEDRMFFKKNTNRYIAFDLNPEYIGFVVLEKIKEDKFKVLHKECVSFKNLNTKLKLSSRNIRQIYQNNKRIFELKQTWKYIFRLAKHYKVAHVVIEQLKFDRKLINENSSEANRLTRNIWHRTKTTNLIQKYCNTIGLKLIEVNACYSSFIGNIKHGFFDPVSAAIEIGRRGIAKFIKGHFYPPLEGSDFDTMYRLGLDVRDKTISTWREAYLLFNESGLRYRQELKNFSEINLQSKKSSTLLYSFV